MSEMSEVQDLIGMVKSVPAEKQTEFIEFLRYSAERLIAGDSVQAIWRDYQEGITKKEEKR